MRYDHIRSIKQTVCTLNAKSNEIRCISDFSMLDVFLCTSTYCMHESIYGCEIWNYNSRL